MVENGKILRMRKVIEHRKREHAQLIAQQERTNSISRRVEYLSNRIIKGLDYIAKLEEMEAIA
jgi:hypothetical protein